MKQYDKIKDEELIFRFKQGRLILNDSFMEKYKNMVRRSKSHVPYRRRNAWDLIQEGMIGLFKAVRDYQPEKGGIFSDLCQNLCGPSDL